MAKKITFVHKPNQDGSPGEPKPTEDPKYAAGLGYVPCEDQEGARVTFYAAQQAQREAAGVPAGTPEVPQVPPAGGEAPGGDGGAGDPATTPSGVTETTNDGAGKATETFLCNEAGCDGKAFANQKALNQHNAQKHK